MRPAAAAGGARLVDVRVPPQGLPVGTGRKRSGRQVLTVGTDCAVGKKYTALSLHAALLAAGLRATFRATGQTGIMIAGEGIPMDAVVADFVAGAEEALSADNEPDHWDVIEGQGSLFHPAYSGVSLGLLHGSQPDAIVLCHDATRKRVAEWEDFELPALDEAIALSEQLARRTNPAARCIGISVNTSALGGQERSDYLAGLRQRHGLSRVAYVDIDAHHGDGVFYGFVDDPDLIFANIHEDGRYLYPGTGAAEETGTGRARGTKLNVPLAAWYSRLSGDIS